MAHLPKCFGRLLHPGVVLTHELNQKMIAFMTMSDERAELDSVIGRLRQQQDETENNLAEALSEDDFQGALRGRPVTDSNEEELHEICNQHLGRIIEKLATNYERLVYLDAEIRKMKSTIEKGITAVNEQAAAAAAESSM
ncbi:uncharacterized protein LOC6645961 [Drosophila willistoni]|uniref:uncharacterized protein LOC6645961 n=1 Tax=Drosophila willistoni TaxID=7260 RepID=UPI001F079E21|nr:uncharacterized protein LOC6645961 [Drosophila willistoni]